MILAFWLNEHQPGLVIWFQDPRAGIKRFYSAGSSAIPSQLHQALCLAAPQSKTADAMVFWDWCGKTIAGGVKEHCYSIMVTPRHIIRMGHFNWTLSIKKPTASSDLWNAEVCFFFFFFFSCLSNLYATLSCRTTRRHGAVPHVTFRDRIKRRRPPDCMLSCLVFTWLAKRPGARFHPEGLLLNRSHHRRLINETSTESRKTCHKVRNYGNLKPYLKRWSFTLLAGPWGHQLCWCCTLSLACSVFSSTGAEHAAKTCGPSLVPHLGWGRGFLSQLSSLHIYFSTAASWLLVGRRTSHVPCVFLWFLSCPADVPSVFPFFFPPFNAVLRLPFTFSVSMASIYKMAAPVSSWDCKQKANLIPV